LRSSGPGAVGGTGAAGAVGGGSQPRWAGRVRALQLDAGAVAGVGSGVPQQQQRCLPDEFVDCRIRMPTFFGRGVRASMEATRTGHPDTYSVRYFLSGCSLVLSIVLCVEYGKMGLFFVASLALILWVGFALVGLGVSLVRRRWRMTASILAAPVVVVLVSSLAHLSGFSADKARLLLWKSSYLADLAKRPGEPAGIQIGIWPWRDYAAGLLAGSPEEIEALVYDRSDQIALPRQSRTAEWISSADKAGYGNSVFIHPEIVWARPEIFDKNSSVTRIWSHFYIIWTEL
jgi:hypothetical protein